MLGSGLAVSSSPARSSAKAALAHSHAAWRRCNPLPRSFQKPLYHSISRYHTKGAAINGAQPTCHQKLKSRISAEAPWLSTIEWLKKNPAPASSPATARNTPQLRRSAFRSTVSPSHTRMMVLNSEIASASQSIAN